MFQYFTKNTCEKCRAIIDWISLVFLFEYRGHIGFLPDGEEFTFVQGSLEDYFKDES